MHHLFHSLPVKVQDDIVRKIKSSKKFEIWKEMMKASKEPSYAKASEITMANEFMAHMLGNVVKGDSFLTTPANTARRLQELKGLNGLDVLHITPEDFDLFSDAFREMDFSDDYMDLFKKRLQRNMKIKNRRRNFIIGVEEELDNIQKSQDRIFAEWQAAIDKADRVRRGEIELSTREIDALRKEMDSYGKELNSLLQKEADMSIYNIGIKRKAISPEDFAAQKAWEEAAARESAEAST